MRTVLAIGLGGAFGALARYALQGLVNARVASAFPWGTLAVNLSGCFLLGVLFTALTYRFAGPTWIRPTLTVGFLGAYTTFSTWALESFNLLEARAYWLAAANVLGSAGAGLVAMYVGVVAGRAL